MSNTGLLILSNPARVKKLLPVIKRHVLQTLYIQYTQQQAKAPTHSRIITNIYTLATSCLSRVDVRVLMPSTSRSAGGITTKRPVELVIFDRNCSGDDARKFIEICLKNRAKSCDFIALTGENDVTETERSAEEGQSYNNVALGGTFDRLHNGHKILLTEAVLHCRQKVTVGVTDESMIRGKLLWELIEPCEARIAAVRDFLEDIDDSLAYHVVPISDMYGPTGTDNDLDLLVVSEETKRGGDKVNEFRRQKNLKPLDIRVVRLVDDAEHMSHEDAKISSSNQRIRLLGTRIREPNIAGKPLRPYVIGLTGGIASGKSSVANKLQSLGAGVVHCDKLAHDLYEPGQRCHEIVVGLFGRSILTQDGRIDRKALADIVFQDTEQLNKLNRAVWPEILTSALSAVQRLHSEGHEVVVMEAAVLIQANWQSACHEIWTCIVPHKEAIKRMMERNGLTEAEAEARIKVQPSNVEQVAAATVVLSTLWSHCVTMDQVNRAWSALQDFLKDK